MSNACSFPHNFYPAYITNWSFILGIENCSKMVTLWPPINTHTHKTIVHFIVSFIILLASYLFFHHLPMQMIFTVSQTLFYNIICITQLMNQPWSFWCQIYKQKQTCTNKKKYIYIYFVSRYKINFFSRQLHFPVLLILPKTRAIGRNLILVTRHLPTLQLN